ncbi:hypothetical protein DMH12_16880 [Streptomyces sp. WAC 04229]|uniref:DUF397 domain-containing protein n=1 Tax=Streptomyces sp. WAC 04229 TaxID=2203206 RepID=UPI000F736A5C|nr:DUF397 domain-containing protein [Streptomyces sp. WAC 04229]RSN54132.1 hypothetical protein DMH12_16880 [Streptomyces sp. WAC 04229]
MVGRADNTYDSRPVSDPRQLRILEVRYDTIRAEALTTKESSVFIEQVLGRHDRLIQEQLQQQRENGNDCVGRETPATIHIRDSKRPDGAHLAVPPAVWTAFVGPRTR